MLINCQFYQKTTFTSVVDQWSTSDHVNIQMSVTVTLEYGEEDGKLRLTI